MPRHPPCALHSLSHTPPTQPTGGHHHPTDNKRPHRPTPTREADGRAHHRHTRQRVTTDESDMAVHTTHYKDARVHYPDLKQQPHTATTPPSRRGPQPAGFPSDRSPNRSPRHTPRLTGRTPDSSEPQQCAPTHRTRTEPATQDRPTTHDHPDPGNTGTGPGNTGTGRGMSMIPLVNTTTIGATRTATHRGVCSLERR
jgi:hypothetical protein